MKPQYIELAAQVNIRTICKCEVTLMTTEQFKLYQHFLSKGIDLDDYTLSIVNELVQNKPVETIAKNLEDKTQVEWKKWLKVILEVLSALALIKELFFSHTQPANSYEITNNYNITETVNINLDTNSDLEKTDSSINNTVNEKE